MVGMAVAMVISVKHEKSCINMHVMRRNGKQKLRQMLK